MTHHTGKGRKRLGATALITLGMACVLVDAAPMYRITVIRSGNLSGPALINDAGMVAGAAHVPGDPWRSTTRSFRWTPDGGLVFSPAIDRNSSTASWNLDAAGQVAIQWTKPEWPQRILMWDGVSDTASRLDKGRIEAGNARGDLVGYVPVSFTEVRRYLWKADGHRIELPAFEGEVYAMNDRREMAGAVPRQIHGRPTAQAAIWSPSGMERLLEPPPGVSLQYSSAFDINDAGEVAGNASGSHWGPFYWSEATGMIPITPGPACESVSAQAINAAGMVVGGGNSCSRTHWAWIWFPGEGARWLDELVDPADPNLGNVTMITAMNINASGQIVVWGAARTPYRSRYVTILLTPLPGRSAPAVSASRPLEVQR